MTIFGEGMTIPAPSESPAEAGHEEDTAVGPEGQEFEVQDFEEEYKEADPDEEEAYPEEEEEETDPENPGDSDPKLLAGKYKSVDDLVKGYQNLQREFSKSRQQPPAQQPAPQTPAAPQTGDDQAKVFWQHFQQNPLGTMQYLIDNAVKAQTAPIVESRQTDVLSRNINEVAKEYKQVRSEEGMQQLFAKVAEIAEDLGNPNLARNPTARVLRMAATEAFGDSKQALYNKAKQAGRQEAEQTRQSKQNLPAARTGSKGNKVNTEQPDSPEDATRKAILAANRGGSSLFG